MSRFLVSVGKALETLVLVPKPGHFRPEALTFRLEWWKFNKLYIKCSKFHRNCKILPISAENVLFFGWIHNFRLGGQGPKCVRDTGIQVFCSGEFGDTDICSHTRGRLLHSMCPEARVQTRSLITVILATVLKRTWNSHFPPIYPQIRSVIEYRQIS